MFELSVLSIAMEGKLELFKPGKRNENVFVIALLPFMKKRLSIIYSNYLGFLSWTLIVENSLVWKFRVNWTKRNELKLSIVCTNAFGQWSYKIL